MQAGGLVTTTQASSTIGIEIELEMRYVREMKGPLEEKTPYGEYNSKGILVQLNHLFLQRGRIARPWLFL